MTSNQIVLDCTKLDTTITCSECGQETQKKVFSENYFKLRSIKNRIKRELSVTCTGVKSGNEKKQIIVYYDSGIPEYVVKALLKRALCGRMPRIIEGGA